jgi:hypothetical protein
MFYTISSIRSISLDYKKEIIECLENYTRLHKSYKELIKDFD